MPRDKMAEITLKPGPRRGPQNDQEQALADEFLRLLTKKRSDDYRMQSKDWDLNEMPLMPQAPPGFRTPTLAPPTIPGQTNAWETLRNIAPELEGLVPRIRYGPTRAGIEMGLKDMGEITSLDGTNIMGTYDLTPQEHGQISLQPRMGGRTAQQTLAHELVHGMGYGEGKTIEGIEKLSDAAWYGPPQYGPPYTADDMIRDLQEKMNKMGSKTKVWIEK